MNKEYYVSFGNEKWVITHDVKETEQLKLMVDNGEDKIYTIITVKEINDFISKRQKSEYQIEQE